MQFELQRYVFLHEFVLSISLFLISGQTKIFYTDSALVSETERGGSYVQINYGFADK